MVPSSLASSEQLTLTDVSVAYKDQTVVHNVHFSVDDGHISCLLGPSGCGKSTLLRAIAGLNPICTGQIMMAMPDGIMQEISSPSRVLSPEKRQIGMVFQDAALFPHLTIAENIAFGISRWPLNQQRSRVKNLLALMGMDAMANRYPDSLSGGQQQRIALARAIAPKPKLLLLDEPFSGLDVSLKEVLITEIRNILQCEQVSALLVTHDQMEAFAMADKVAVMNEGRIVQHDTAYHIYHQPRTRFVANFIGEGDFLSGIVLDEQRVQSALGILRSSVPHGFAISQSVDILVRPDDLLHDDGSSFNGVIVNKRFRGSHFLYRIELPSRQHLFCLAPSHHNHAVGENIAIKLDLDHLVMFAT
jgi:iron(III) transport system ATP-binding protein